PDSGCRSEQRRVLLRLEAYLDGAVLFENRALDHRRLRQHQLDGLRLVEIRLLLVRQLLEGRAGLVQHLLPAGGGAPALKLLARNALRLVVVEGVVDAIVLQPGEGLLHRVAILDAVDRDAHSRWSIL